MKTRMLLGIGPVLGLVAFDLLFRKHFVGQFSAGQWVLYLLSAAYVVLCGFLFWTLLRSWAASPVRRWMLAGAMGALSAFLYTGQYLYFSYLGVLPNVATYQYIFANWAESAANAADASTAPVLSALAGSALLFTGLWRFGYGAWRVPAGPAPRPWKSALAVLALTPVMYHNVTLEQGTALPSVHAVFSVVDAAQNSLFSGDEYRKYLHVGNRIKLPARGDALPFNVLLIVDESVRADRLSEYGAKRDTSPKVNAFLRGRAGRAFLFDRFYTNSTTTRESYPSILTGVHPCENFAKLHNLPLVYEYTKSFANSYAFLASSHAYDHNNLRLFIRSEALDAEMYRELSDGPATNNEGRDDMETVVTVERFLDQVPPGQRFMGVAHFNTTHFPYYAPKAFQRFGRKRVDRYDNALAYLDSVHAALLAALERRGLLDDTVVISTSDHGEAFGEHGVYGHQSMFYEEGIHIPFWMLLPEPLAGRHRGALEAGRHRLHSNVDIVPTLIELLGLTTDPVLVEVRSQLMGKSLLESTEAEGPPVVVYNGYSVTSLRRGFALADGSYRVLLRPDRKDSGQISYEAYDLERDPGERRNVWKEADRTLRERWLADLQSFPALRDDFRDVLRGEVVAR